MRESEIIGVVPPMNEDLAELTRVGRTRLESVMRQALGRSTAQLSDWEWSSLPYLSILPGRTLARCTGWALLDDGQLVPWSAVVKLFQQPAPDHSSQIASDTREILAYRSSLLVNLPGALRAPRVLGIDEDDTGAVWLWLEDVHDLYAHRWPLEQYGLAARHLGFFNGTYLVSRVLPTDSWLNSWLNRHWAEQHAELQRIPDYLAELQRIMDLPPVQRVFGPSIGARTRQLVDDQAQFMRTLSLLPQALCHHDAALANLFAGRRSDGEPETVAVDWEKIGPGAVGAEIATLVFGTMRRCEFAAERAAELEQVVFAGYMAGLREAGWEGDVEQVRLGYASATALRWIVVASTIRMLIEGALPVRTTQGWQVSPDALIQQRVRLSEFLLDRADEARRLVARLRN
jgi:hypothetical protein